MGWDKRSEVFQHYERVFLHNMANSLQEGSTLTPKQTSWLLSLLHKARHHGLLESKKSNNVSSVGRWIPIPKKDRRAGSASSPSPVEISQYEPAKLDWGRRHREKEAGEQFTNFGKKKS